METCPEHQRPTDFYCERCESTVCVRCKVESHKSHKVIQLSKKCKTLEKKLKSFQKNFSKRQETLEWHCSSLETYAKKIKKAIRDQYLNVKRLFFEAYQRQVAEIDNIMNVEQEKCMVEEEKYNKVQGVADRTADLLSNSSHSSSFVTQCIKLLLEKNAISSNTPEYSPDAPTYVAPKIKYMSLSKDFLKVAERLLGHCKKKTFPSETGFRMYRSQSLVEVPTFEKLPNQPLPSVASSVGSVTFSASSRHRSVPELGQYIREVCLCLNYNYYFVITVNGTDNFSTLMTTCSFKFF